MPVYLSYHLHQHFLYLHVPTSTTNKRKKQWCRCCLINFYRLSLLDGKCSERAKVFLESVRSSRERTRETLNLCGSRPNLLIIRSKHQRIPKHTRSTYIYTVGKKRERKNTFHRQLSYSCHILSTFSFTTMHSAFKVITVKLRYSKNQETAHNCLSNMCIYVVKWSFWTKKEKNFYSI